MTDEAFHFPRGFFHHILATEIMEALGSTAIDPWVLLDEVALGAICVLDGGGRISYVNRGVGRLFAPEAAQAAVVGGDFFGRLIPLLGAGEDVASLGRAARAAMGGRRGQVVEVAILGAAGRMWLSVRLTPLASGVSRPVMLHLTDITASKTTEKLLRDQEQRLNHHFIQSPLAIIEWNSRLECTDWNPAAEKIFGYRRDEVIGKSAVSLVFTEDRHERETRSWADVLRLGRASRRVSENRRRNGTSILCEWYDTPFEDQAGNVVGATSLVQDITEHRRTLEMLRHSVTAEVQKAELAEREGREKDRLIHELDQKLQIIADQHAQIVDLSMPILEVWDDVLAVPIIGEMDAQRSELIMDRLLPAIVAKGSRYVILDLTGVKEVDHAAAEHCTQVIQAVRLLGAIGVLTGIRPALAQAIVSLGGDVTPIVSFRSLREGLKACRRATGFRAKA